MYADKITVDGAGHREYNRPIDPAPLRKINDILRVYAEADASLDAGFRPPRRGREPSSA